MIIDTHTHIFHEQDYQEYTAKAGNTVAKILSVYFWSVEQPGGKGKTANLGIDEMIDFAKGKDNLFVVGAVNVDTDIARQLSELEPLLRTGKIVGIKLYPGYQYFYPSDEKIHPIAALCQRYDRPLLFHSGDFYDADGHALLKYSRPIYIDELAVKFPACRIVIAHFGFPYLLETANIVAKHDNVYTEISGTIVNFSSGKDNRKLLEQYADDLRRTYSYFPSVRKKTMFGSDFSGAHTPLNQILPYIELVRRVFSEEEQRHVFYQLADELFFNG